MISNFWIHLKHASRSLAKSPGFSLPTVLILALGIGVNAAVFTVLNGVLVRPLPYQNPGQLNLIRVDQGDTQDIPAVSGPELRELRTHSNLISSFGAMTREFTTNISTGGDKEPVLSAYVTSDLFPTIGVAPAVGRFFTSEDEGLDANRDAPVTIISYRLWQTRFGGDPNILERTIQVGTRTIPIVGVMPESFRLLLGPATNVSPDIDLWRPMGRNTDIFTGRILRSICRLADGVSLAQAQSEMDAIAKRLVSSYPDIYDATGVRIRLAPLHEDYVREIRPAILTLAGAAGLILLIACTNVIGLSLVRTRAREKEMAVRAALGAGRWRIVQQVITESFLLAVLAGGVGLVLANWGVSSLIVLQPGTLPRAGDISIDGTVLLFTLLLSFLTCIAIGSVSAAQASKLNLQETLKEGARQSSGSVRRRFRYFLIAGEVALSLILLVGAGLLIRTFANLLRVDLGFDSRSVLTAATPIDDDKFKTPESRWTYFRQLMEKIRSMPGVTEVGGIDFLPLSGGGSIYPFAYDAESEADWGNLSADYRIVLPGYFETMGIRLLAGRRFTEQDNNGTGMVVVIDETLAQLAWPDRDPIGQRILVRAPGNAPPEWVKVIGVVKHSRINDIRAELRPQIYRPYVRNPRTEKISVVVRTEADPVSLAPLIRREAERLGAGMLVYSIAPMDEYVSAALGDTRFSMFLIGVLAIAGIALVALGIYGAIAYLVSQRSFDTALRLAIGARSADIIQMNLKESLVPTFIGVFVGLFGTLHLTRFLETQLFGVAGTDPLTLISTSLFLILVALLASYIPIRRALAVGPMAALRNE